MKNKSILRFMFGALFLGVLGLSSCKKCETCTRTTGQYIESQVECMEDYSSGAKYRAYLNALEDVGYKCN